MKNARGGEDPESSSPTAGERKKRKRIGLR